MKKVIAPFAVNEYYHCGLDGKIKQVWDKNPYPLDHTTPIIRRIHFSNISAGEVAASAGFLYGLPELPIATVSFDNISVQLAADAVAGMPEMMCRLQPVSRQGFFCCNVSNIFFNNVTISGPVGPAFQIENVRNIELSHCLVEQAQPEDPVIRLKNVDQALVAVSRVAKEQQTYLEIQGSQSSGIEITGRPIDPHQIRFTEGADPAAVVK
jgi:hypothetical protein